MNLCKDFFQGKELFFRNFDFNIFKNESEDNSEN